MAYVERGDFGFTFVIKGRGHGREGTYVQTDWDYPSTAEITGWSILRVQKRKGRTVHMRRIVGPCNHYGTDGTVDCKVCGIKASEFIAAAHEHLDRVAR